MTQPLTKEQIAEIKALAEAATAGPWEHQDIDLSDGIDRGCCFVIASSGGLIAGALPWPTELDTAKYDRVLANGDFIAAANPSAILALIATLEARDAAFDEMLAALKLADDLVIAPMRNRKLVMDEHRHTVDEAIRQAIAHAEKVK